MAALGDAHPDLRERATRVEITRHGHVMAIPAPGLIDCLSIGLQAPSNRRRARPNGERAAWIPTPATARLAFAHGDWSGHSVFEDAFTRGHGAGLLSAI